MTILVLGGTGKTGGVLTKLLHEAGLPFLVASRSGKAPEPYKAVTFDWFDPSTFENPFKADSSIDKVYLVLPVAHYDTLPVVAPFIDLAISKGVKRIVLLTALQGEPGSPAFGVVQSYLETKDIEYVVLRPSWFSQNFASLFIKSIRENDEVFSATGEGKIPWISSEDVAQAAFDTLTTPESIRKDLLVVGPELLTYDEAASILSNVLGRTIKHKKHTPEEQMKAFSQVLTPEFSQVMVDMEVAVAQGLEEKYFKEPASRLYVGKHRLEDYFKANRDIWTK
ncbi:NAD(P)-binding protein [Agrocybe pediades]|nr:NAD(P)-binding protein [Agrocybe pediades]